MSVFELAEQLGHALSEDERYKEMKKAEQFYQEDEALQALISRYNETNQKIREEAEKPERDLIAVDEMQKEANDLYDLILAHPTYQVMRKAEDGLNELLNAVNQMITFAMTGTIPDSCTHDCSTCGGCHS
ncbi:MAG: YlbF family regulator [Clostridia bacterium]|nr:YlbF family regulator [Clostridia bacterium]MBQ3927338.1 YlbF family regulator [Clostridia bacterium]MBQ7728618.1 YlbF family regulator [Clostridia bacterium]